MTKIFIFLSTFFFFFSSVAQTNDKSENIYFGNNSSIISLEEFKKLETILSFNDLIKIELKGYTDNRGSSNYNLSLSQKRVKEVESKLISLGVNPQIIQSSFFGISNLNTFNNRRVEINYFLKKAIPISEIIDKVENSIIDKDTIKIINNNIELNNFLYQGVQTQKFNISNSTDEIIKTKDGIIISFKANSFNTNCSDSIRLEIKEFNDKTSMILGNMTTTSNGKLIYSYGMFDIKAYCNEQKVQLNKKMDYTVLVPKERRPSLSEEKTENAKLFYGHLDSTDHSLNWKTDNKNLKTIDFGSLNDKLDRKKVCFLINMFRRENLNWGYVKPSKLREDIEKDLVENFDNLSKVSMNDIQYFIMKPKELNLINCDEFYLIPKDELIAQDIILKTKNLINTKVEIVFKERRSIMQASGMYQYKAEFLNLPKGLEAKAVALRLNGNSIELAIKEFITGQEVEITEFTKLNSYEELTAMLKTIE